ncbi:MAG: nitroreductase family protein [Thermodesulfobacteriota bacterium]
MPRDARRVNESNDFDEVVRSARAQRRLRRDPIPDEAIESMLRAASYAPSGMNSQPWRFVVVRDAELREAIGNLYASAWQIGRQAYDARPARSRAEARMLENVDYLAEHFGEAPVIVAACLDRRRLDVMVDAKLEWRDPVPVLASVLPAVQNLILAARAHGVGTVLTTLHRLRHEELRGLLGIPATVEVVALLPLGYPEEPFRPLARPPVAAFAARDRWDGAW